MSLELQSQWLAELRPGAVSSLFEFLPDTLYFAKDRDRRLMAGNRAFVERCGFSSEAEMVGHVDREIFPVEMAEKFRGDDKKVIESGEPLLGIVELFPNRIGEPEWFVTDKIPLFTRGGECAGLCGIVRSFEGAHSQLRPYLDLLPVTDYMKKHFTGKLSMPEVAKKFGMSTRSMQRQFLATFKTTPQKYIAKLRILRACELLVKTGMTITEIALEVGFYDHSAFSRKFSEILGVSPRAYRKRYESET